MSGQEMPRQGWFFKISGCDAICMRSLGGDILKQLSSADYSPGGPDPIWEYIPTGLNPGFSGNGK